MDYTVADKELPVFRDDRSRGKTPYLIGRAQSLGSARIRALHEHTAAEAGICLSGSGECRIGSRVYQFRAGCIQIIPSGVPHLACADPNSECRWVWIYFDAVRMMQICGLTDPDGILSLAGEGLTLCGVFTEDEYPALTDAVKSLAACADVRDDKSDLSAALAVGTLLIRCARIGGTIPSRSAPPIQAALDAIAEHPDDAAMLSEPALAARCGMSVSGFRRLFHIHTGLSPKTFIIRSRMAYAEYLLRESDLSIMDIAVRTGYGDISGFSRMFSSFFGVSPGRYRRGR